MNYAPDSNPFIAQLEVEFELADQLDRVIAAVVNSNAFLQEKRLHTGEFIMLFMAHLGTEFHYQPTLVKNRRKCP